MSSITSRRSIRRYTREAVPEEAITEILKAAMCAPSAGNEQPWHFIVITDRSTLDEIPKIHPYSSMLKEASVAILVCGDETLEKHKGYWVQDCSAAMENMLLMATELGLGSVWLGVYPLEDRVEGMRELFGIPSHITPFSLLPLGYPAEEKPPADRYNASRVHTNKW